MTPQEQVMEFHRVFGVKIGAPISDAAAAELRVRLMREEMQEIEDALAAGDLHGVADGLADLAYVTYGSAVTWGIDLDVAFDEVHRSNMTKLGPDGRPRLRADGKVMKPDNWIPPDMTESCIGASL